MKKRRLLVLIAVLLFQLALGADLFRRPDHQLTARMYVGAVHVYQVVGRPRLKGIIACRFRPTCSDYSIAAVEKYGTVKGLVLTGKRVLSCQNSVPMGTVDPVPQDY